MVIATEGGCADFGPIEDAEIELLRSIQLHTAVSPTRWLSPASVSNACTTFTVIAPGRDAAMAGRAPGYRRPARGHQRGGPAGQDEACVRALKCTSRS